MTPIKKNYAEKKHKVTDLNINKQNLYTCISSIDEAPWEMDFRMWVLKIHALLLLIHL